MFKDLDAKDLFIQNKLGTFEDLWNKKYEWFEAPNEGKAKNSWSGVSKLTLNDQNFFIKKQHNYRKPSVLHPFGENLAEKEFKNIELFKNLQLPTMDAIYFQKKKIKGQECAILITKSLDSYDSLDNALNSIVNQKDKNISKRRLAYDLS